MKKTKKIIIFLLFLFCIKTVSMPQIEVDVDNMNTTSIVKITKLRVGLEQLGYSRKIIIKPYNGRVKLIYKNKSIILEEGEEEVLLYVDGKISLRGDLTKNLNIIKLSNIVITGFSKNNGVFKTYRGNFEIKATDRGIFIINEILPEEYLYSVIPSEIGLGFPAEAIKAQAIVARTYLYNNLENSKYIDYHVDDTIYSQVYNGYKAENEEINKLIDETADEIIVYNDKPILALFHSASGGYTANNEDVWGNKPVSYLRAVDDSDNWLKCPKPNWQLTVTKNQLSNLFNFRVDGIEILEKSYNRVKKVALYGSRRIIITADELRKRIGYNKLHSAVFDVYQNSTEITFSGRGYGHGVGLSQWGAYGLALKGYSYREIIKYYYTNVEIRKL